MSERRVVVVVGDATIATLLAYVPVEWDIVRTDTVTSLLEGRRNGTLPRQPDGVVFTDLTGATNKELLNGVGTMLLSRVPVAVICYDNDTMAYLERSYPSLEEAIIAAHARFLAHRAEQGIPVSDEDRINPTNTTFLTIASASGGASRLLAEFGPTLRQPIAVEKMSNLGAQYDLPFPHPTGTGFAAVDAVNKRKGRILTVISDKGGCGKTSTALFLGASIAYHTYMNDQPKSVVIVDLDRQSQLASQFPSANGKSATQLKANSTADEVIAALHAVPQIGNLYLLLGGKRSGDHLAMRTVELYEHVITTLAELFDVVIVDGSVGTTSDPVTAWAQQHSDGVYYVLDPSTESLSLAADARHSSLLSVDNGGLGLDPSRFRVIENRVLLSQSPAQRAAWETAMADRLGDTIIEAVIPDSHPEVTLSKNFEGGVLELVQTSEVLREPLRLLAKRIYPDIIKDEDDKDGKVKRRLFGGK